MASHITIPMARLIELETAEHERDILRTENAALKREAHTWWTACKDATQELERLRAAQRPLTDHDRALTGAKVTAPAGIDC